MDAVFVRTQKGEAEITSRSDQLSHTAWLTLVMIDGRTSAAELADLKPRLHDLEQSLKLLADAKFIDVAPATVADAPPEEPPPTLDAEWRQPQPEEEEFSHERVVKVRVKRRRKISFQWLRRLIKRTTLAVVFLFLIALAALFLFPLSVYVPHVEKLLAEKIGQSVSVTSMRFVLEPRPALVLEGLSVGQNVKIARATVVPDWSTVHQPVKVISAIEFESSAMEAGELAKLHTLLKRDSLRFRTILFNDLKVDAGGVPLGPMSGEARLGNEGGLQKAFVSAPGLKAEMTPSGENLRVTITGKNWQLPIGPALIFESLSASGTANADALSLGKIEASAYGGVVNGAAQLNWRDGWSGEGTYSLKNLDLETLVPVFSKQFSISGSLNGDFRLAAKSAALAGLLDSPKIEASFKAIKGVLQNVDLVETIKNAKSTRGGKTIFDEITGNAAVAGEIYQFKQCKLASGMLGAAGQFNVSAADQLSGRIAVEFKPIPERGQMAIQIGGTVADPVLKPVP
ncbi:MAG: AsmA family protein [Burkholderiales bacterium]